MFDKNDRTLLTVRALANVFTIIFVVCSVVAGIAVAACGMLEIGLPILFCGPFLFWIAWLAIRLHLTHLCDIKLIRNKLYGIENNALDVFINKTAYVPAEEQTPAFDKQNAFTYEQLEKLNHDGFISNEEFERRTRALLKKEEENLRDENGANVPKANDADDFKE